MRLFFAVPISDEVKEAVSRAVGRFPIGNPPWRWIPSQNYHITIKFLGETEETIVPALIDRGLEVASAARPFDLVFGPFGSFPSLSKPRVLFFAAEQGGEELAALALDIDRTLEPLGFERERRAFRAHLTLARVKRVPSREVQQALASVPTLSHNARQRVDRFILMSSTLSREGARYEEIHAFRLGP
jgi:2'-5' RNA ligase